jgi:hypothetical protein
MTTAAGPRLTGDAHLHLGSRRRCLGDRAGMLEQSSYDGRCAVAVPWTLRGSRCGCCRIAHGHRHSYCTASLQFCQLDITAADGNPTSRCGEPKSVSRRTGRRPFARRPMWVHVENQVAGTSQVLVAHAAPLHRASSSPRKGGGHSCSDSLPSSNRWLHCRAHHACPPLKGPATTGFRRGQSATGSRVKQIAKPRTACYNPV